jgi:hypothetical protein
VTDRQGLAVDVAPAVIEALRAALPAVAAQTVAAVTTEVTEYRTALVDTGVAATIERAVELALATFLSVASDEGSGDGARQSAPALEAAYALGRGEARAGRTMEALLAAYRVGARTAWQELSALLVRRRVPAGTVARFAQLVFAYIDELSSASVGGHRDELAASGRVREQLLERLAVGLVMGEPAEALAVRAERAGWEPPETLTAVVLRSAHLSHAARLLDPRTLRLAGDLAPGLESHNLAVLLVPDAHRSRPALLSALSGRAAIIGPTRPWGHAAVSYQRVLRALVAIDAPTDEALDTEAHLVELVVTADRDAFGDLRERALQPLAGVRPAAAERLVETLRSWLLHQGRRDEVALELGVHPQTVRYRMTQLRELFGDRLNDPRATLELVVALSVSPPGTDRR